MAGFGNSNPGGEYLIPYTDSLFADFYAAYGYDLRDFLPELFLWPNGEKVSPVKWQYMELIQRLFAENFLSPISLLNRFHQQFRISTFDDNNRITATNILIVVAVLM